jgi:hypothetical protein
MDVSVLALARLSRFFNCSIRWDADTGVYINEQEVVFRGGLRH